MVRANSFYGMWESAVNENFMDEEISLSTNQNKSISLDVQHFVK